MTRKLSPDAHVVLCVAPGTTLEAEAPGTFVIGVGRHRTRMGSHAPAVLDAFRTATSLEQGLRLIGHRLTDINAMSEVMQTIRELREIGALLEQGELTAARLKGELEYHARLLNDRTRTRAFLDGVARTVRPGDVVVDIGTGSGVLAVAAAKAGARRVFAIEQGSIGEVACATFAANGVADRVELVDGWSQDIELPEKADVLITETVGDDPLAEHLLEVVTDARRRLLKRGARLVPRGLTVQATPVQIADHALEFGAARHTAAEVWWSWYGIDLNALADASAGREPSFLASAAAVRRWKALGPIVTLLDVDLARFPYPTPRGWREFEAERSGRLDGLVTHFELDVGPSTALSTRPGRAGSDNSWMHRVIVLDEPLALERGDRYEVSWDMPPGPHQHEITASVRRVGRARGGRRT